MNIHFDDANEHQLRHIIYYEDCSLDYKYAAARELQLRSFRDDMLPDLIRLWGQGWSSFDIAIELGVPMNRVQWQLQKYDLYGRRVSHDKLENRMGSAS